MADVNIRPTEEKTARRGWRVSVTDEETHSRSLGFARDRLVGARFDVRGSLAYRQGSLLGVEIFPLAALGRNDCRGHWGLFVLKARLLTVGVRNAGDIHKSL